jgi:hypothetical protein
VTDGGWERWLLVAVSTAGTPDSLRVTVWRRLRGLGALYVQQSVCLLPDRPHVARAVAQLAVKVRADGGSARVLHLRVDQPDEQAQLVEEMRAAIDAEYGEVLDRLPEFFTELDTETARGRVTFAEVEESEADLARFKAWLTKITARDYFAAPLGERVRAELDRAGRALAGFEAAALAADTTVAPAPAVRSGARRLRTVPGQHR